MFLAANKRAQVARGRHLGARRPITLSSNPRASMGLPEAQLTKSPKSKSEADPMVIMGELVKEIGRPAEPSAPTALELALQRLSEGVFGKPRGG